MPGEERVVPRDAIALQLPCCGSYTSQVIRLAPSNPPTAKTLPSRTPMPTSLRAVPMGAMAVQLPATASYTSAVLKLAPSVARPPTA